MQTPGYTGDAAPRQHWGTEQWSLCSLQPGWRRVLRVAVHKLLAKLALHGLLNSGTQMSHLCFISASAALRLSTSAPGNNGLAQAHPHQLAGDLLCRPGLCLLSALSRRLDGSLSPERLSGPLLAWWGRFPSLGGRTVWVGMGVGVLHGSGGWAE